MKTLEIIFESLAILVFLVILFKSIRINLPSLNPFRRMRRNNRRDEALSCMMTIIRKADFEYINSIRVKENKITKDQRLIGLSEAISNLRAICDNH